MSVIKYTRKHVYVTTSQIAIALVCLSSPLLVINATWAKVTETQISSQVQQLKNPQQRSSAIDYLASVGKPAVPALITALQDSDAQVRSSAAITLGKIGAVASEAIPALMRLADDKDATVGSQAFQAIAKIDKKAFVPLLVKGLNSDKSWQRYSAAHALRAMGKNAAPAVPALIQKLEDEDVWLRVNVATALGRIGVASKPAVPRLVNLLQDKDVTVRHSAAYALGEIALSLQENISQLPTKELDILVTNLEKAMKVVQNPSLKFREYAITSVSDPLAMLKKERLSR